MSFLPFSFERAADAHRLSREYPGGGGDSGNEESTSDTANFLLFLTALRAAVGPNKRLSTCVTQSAFLGADGSPLADVSAFAKVLDSVLVMNYDVWGGPSLSPCPLSPTPVD